MLFCYILSYLYLSFIYVFLFCIKQLFTEFKIFLFLVISLVIWFCLLGCFFIFLILYLLIKLFISLVSYFTFICLEF